MSETTRSKLARVAGRIAVRTTSFPSLDLRSSAASFNLSFSDGFVILARFEELGVGVLSPERLEECVADIP